VLQAGIGRADEVPAEFGVMQFDGSALDVLRPAPRRAMRLGVAAWVALARATAEGSDGVVGRQQWLGDDGGPDERLVSP
jgi:hypothetical protein